jgi:hypothetical protein
MGVQEHWHSLATVQPSYNFPAVNSSTSYRVSIITQTTSKKGVVGNTILRVIYIPET